MGGAVAVAILGLLVHNAREFGVPAVLASENGELPLALLLGVLFLGWWRIPRLRFATSCAITGIATLHLIGGAVVTAIPFGFLPFVPDPSLEHYLSHFIYGATQLPLITVGILEIATSRARQVPQSID